MEEISSTGKKPKAVAESEKVVQETRASFTFIGRTMEVSTK
jgi:hypothetical protein